MYQLGWFPDYSDADNYLVPFFYDTDETPSFLANHYRNEEINKELTDQASIADKGERAKAIEDIQNQLAEEPYAAVAPGQPDRCLRQGRQGRRGHPRSRLPVPLGSAEQVSTPTLRPVAAGRRHGTERRRSAG